MLPRNAHLIILTTQEFNRGKKGEVDVIYAVSSYTTAHGLGLLRRPLGFETSSISISS